MKINTPLKQEEIANYTNVITSLVNSAILATEGASQGDIYSRNKLPRNVGVFIDNKTKQNNCNDLYTLMEEKRRKRIRNEQSITT